MHQTFEDICTTCGQSEMRRERVRSAIWHDNRLVVVEGIAALLCGACGERYYEPEACAALEALRTAGFPTASASREVRVPVFSLAPSPQPIAHQAAREAALQAPET